MSGILWPVLQQTRLQGLCDGRQLSGSSKGTYLELILGRQPSCLHQAHKGLHLDIGRGRKHAPLIQILEDETCTLPHSATFMLWHKELGPTSEWGFSAKHREACARN